MPKITKRIPLTADQQALAEAYVPMARNIAKPFKRDYPGHVDMFDSAALFGLVQAAQTFDSSRGVNFGAFAKHRIYGELYDTQIDVLTPGWITYMSDGPKTVGLSYNSEENGEVLMSQADRPVGEVFEGNEFVEKYLRCLPQKHANICREIYLNNKTQIEVARMIGCSRSRLCYLHQEALEMIQNRLEYDAKKDPYAD